MRSYEAIPGEIIIPNSTVSLSENNVLKWDKYGGIVAVETDDIEKLLFYAKWVGGGKGKGNRLARASEAPSRALNV